MLSYSKYKPENHGKKGFFPTTFQHINNRRFETIQQKPYKSNCGQSVENFC